MKTFLILLTATFVFTFYSHAQTTAYPEMVVVEGGTFEMGDEHGDGEADEQPVHSVTLKTFSIAKTETTVKQWKTYCQETGRSMPSDTPKEGWKDDHPMVYVNWHDAVAYCDWLSDKNGKLYRLPTEAEWEYAARGGKLSKGFKYSGGQSIDMTGWYDENAGGGTKPVAQKRANELGLYDMSGNVWEWCKDWWDEKYYATSPKENPKGPATGSDRVLRGGGWSSSAARCRVADRYINGPAYRYSIIGFRVVLSQ